MKVRHAQEGDVAAIASIHVHAWQAAYRGILADELLDGLSLAEREESWRGLLGDSGRWLTLVAERFGGELAGFCSVATPSRDAAPDERVAELGAIYVDPEHWRQGAGGALLTVALQELQELGYKEAILWVLPENRAAIAFYECFGFELEEGVEKREERSGGMVVRFRVGI